MDYSSIKAENIDAYFGFDLPLAREVEIPAASPDQRLHWGRVNMPERPAAERAEDFSLMERGLTDEEARLECSRCLRCDHFGCGAFRRG